MLRIRTRCLGGVEPPPTIISPIPFFSPQQFHPSTPPNKFDSPQKRGPLILRRCLQVTLLSYRGECICHIWGWGGDTSPKRRCLIFWFEFQATCPFDAGVLPLWPLKAIACPLYFSKIVGSSRSGRPIQTVGSTHSLRKVTWGIPIV